MLSSARVTRQADQVLIAWQTLQNSNRFSCKFWVSRLRLSCIAGKKKVWGNWTRS